MRDVMKALQEHAQAVVKAGYKSEEILGVFCYGSQNYGFADEHSDVDSKAIIIPKFYDLCFLPPVSKEIHLENGEHCEVKDIREIIKMFCKQNLNFVEILFTEYCYINPEYEALWNFYFKQHGERIAHYNPMQTVMSICGQAMHTLKQNPTDGKKFADGLRMYNFLTEYLHDKPYAEAMKVPEKGWKEHVMHYKRGRLTPTERETEILVGSFRQLRDSYKDQGIMDTEIATVMREGVMSLIARRNNLPLSAILE